jgi:hypothetical protein
MGGAALVRKSMIGVVREVPVIIPMVGHIMQTVGIMTVRFIAMVAKRI